MSRKDEIARIGYEVHRFLRLAQGEDNVLSWERASAEDRNDATAAVENAVFFFKDGETPGSAHDAWVKSQEEDGWSYDEEHSDHEKTDPRMRPYEDLPEEQRTKDAVYWGVVNALRSAGAVQSPPFEPGGKA